MFDRKFKPLVLLVVGVILFSLTTNIQANTKKLSGIDRYATSAEIVLDNWEESIHAILVYGEDFSDALSAVPLTKKYCIGPQNAAILLTERDHIPKETLDVIRKLHVNDITIIGGTGVISLSVENQLNALGINTNRLSGLDKYETNIIIANQLDNVSEIAIVTGEDFADALSVAPIAANKNMPIIFVRHNEIPDVVKEYIKLHKITRSYVIGVGSWLDESIVSELPNVEQINGQDKYQRNLAIMDKFKSELDVDTIYLTSGVNFFDGLSGAAAASNNCNPMLLVGENSIAQKAYLDSNLITNYNVVVLGGTVPEAAIIGSDNIDYEEKKIIDITNIKSDAITKIIFYDGSGRNKPLTVEDNQKIREFFGYLDDYLIKKAKNPELSAGWIHNAKFYINDKEVMNITFVDPMIINAKDYYNIIKGNLDTDKIDKYLKSIDPGYIYHN